MQAAVNNQKAIVLARGLAMWQRAVVIAGQQRPEQRYCNRDRDRQQDLKLPDRRDRRAARPEPSERQARGHAAGVVAGADDRQSGGAPCDR